MEEHKNSTDGSIDQQNPPPRPTITSWEELADRIAAGHRIALTMSRNGEVIETFEFNDETKPDTLPRRPAPVVADEDQEPSTESQAQVAAKVFALARKLWRFVRLLTVKDGFLFLGAATFFAGAGVFVLYSLLVVTPFILGLAVVVFAHKIAGDMIPEFPGKSVFVTFLIMLVCASAYAYFMR